jgi:periplasmic divalent cation tolerance protein
VSAAAGAGEVIVVLVTVPSPEVGAQLGRVLVSEGIVACVNVVGPIRSIYAWDGQVMEDDEHLLLIKTRRERFGELEGRVRALHSYAVPEILALDVVAGSAPYVDWLLANTGTTAGER